MKKDIKIDKRAILGIIVICLSTLFSSYATAAFCSLRDPVETIKTLYPQSTSFKSVVKIIDEDVRSEVQSLLPPNTLHFSELGKHTLYIAFKKEEPLGYVHVRSEESNWGLVEIAWSINLNMEIDDFKFQRCRNRQKRVLEKDEFRQQLQGKNFEQIIALLNNDGMTLNPQKITVPPKAKALAEVVLRCGMKTLLVTQLAWSKEINKYRLYASAKIHFKQMSEIVVMEHAVKKSLSHLKTIFGEVNTGIDRSSVKVAKVFDTKQSLLGLIYIGDLTIDRSASTVEWAISPVGKVIGVNNLMGWKHPSTQRAFENTVGNRYSKVNHCNNRAELVTLEALLTAKTFL